MAHGLGSTGQRVFLTLVLVLVAFGGTQEVRAAEGATCTVTFVIVLDPGFSVRSSTGTHRSEQPGVLNCDGTVNGRTITGPGTIADEGLYGTSDGDSCLSGSEGTGVDHITLPTAEGPETVRSHFEYTAAKPSNGSPLRGQFTGTRFSGTFDLRPLEGDCLTAPITKVEITAEGLLSD